MVRPRDWTNEAKSPVTIPSAIEMCESDIVLIDEQDGLGPGVKELIRSKSTRVVLSAACGHHASHAAA